MRILHRGLIIELEPGDPRIFEVERAVFGASLPPQPAPEPPSEPVTVSEGVRALWKAMPKRYRRELALLAEREWKATDLEAALGLTQRQLNGWHSGMGRHARARNLPAPVSRRGRGRAGRRYFLEETLAAELRALLAEEAGR